jgi:hypothetical protein
LQIVDEVLLLLVLLLLVPSLCSLLGSLHALPFWPAAEGTRETKQITRSAGAQEREHNQMILLLVIFNESDRCPSEAQLPGLQKAEHTKPCEEEAKCGHVERRAEPRRKDGSRMRIYVARGAFECACSTLLRSATVATGVSATTNELPMQHT